MDNGGGCGGGGFVVGNVCGCGCCGGLYVGFVGDGGGDLVGDVDARRDVIHDYYDWFDGVLYVF